MKNILLLPLLLCFTSMTQAVTGNVALGNLQFTDASATHSNKSTEDYKSIDGVGLGNYQGVNGWSPNTDVSQNITWTWQALSTPTLLPGESVAHYTYNIQLHCGYLRWDGTGNYDYLLRSFRLALADPANANTFSTITDYQSVSNTQGAKGHTISVDANGLITTTKPNVSNLLDVYTLSFRSPVLTNQLRLITTAGVAGWSGLNSFIIREITGDVSATVVPTTKTLKIYSSSNLNTWNLLESKTVQADEKTRFLKTTVSATTVPTKTLKVYSSSGLETWNLLETKAVEAPEKTLFFKTTLSD